MALTPNQKLAVETAGRPLFIQAGAGTGKTFTLTNRLAYGLSDESGRLIPGVENLLTITFTNKAAGELLGRVRAELRRRGLVEEALRVDAAWISTIHSMCRHILQEHAFEVGIDPGAQLLTEEESSDLRDQALEDMLKQQGDSVELQRLLEAYGVDDAIALVGDLASRLALAPRGVETFDLGPKPAPATITPLSNLLAELTGMKEELGQLGEGEESTTYLKAYRILCTVVGELKEFVGAPCDAPSWRRTSSFLEGLPEVKGGNTPKQYREAFKTCRARITAVRVEAASAAAGEELRMALSLAEGACARHRASKRALGAVDTDDLLIETYRLLESRPGIAHMYRERFATVMIDEFQDTDLLQVEIVKRFCDDALSTLTTVGDAQQSIYGFRGADLEVYREVRAQMAACGSREVELTTNFRSHPDILRFVETIFSKPEFFGTEFLKVEAGQGNVRPLSWVDGAEPRVKLLVSAGEKAPRGSGATGVAALRASDAALVADEFERYKAAGADYGDMAILLSSIKSTKAGAYVSELRRRGIPCIIAGGSEFYTQPEVVLLVLFLRFLEDQDDDEALFALLGSRLFDIPDDDLLELWGIARQRLHIAADEARTKASLWDAVAYLARTAPERVSLALLHAHGALREALDSAPSTPLSTVVMRLVRHSGWYAQLQGDGVEGSATFANIQRLCDLLDDFERSSGHAVVAAAEHFREMCELAQAGAGARGKPGTMVSDGNAAVRIMTIHASKGLEFPIVAVAEYEKSGKRQAGPEPQALTEDGTTYLALQPKVTGDASGHFKDEEADICSFADASDPDEFCVHAKQLADQREKEESQRLLYVALTRAREVLLLVAHDSRLASSGKFAVGLTHDVMEAVYPEGTLGEAPVFKTDTGALVAARVATVPYGGADEEAEQGEEPLESSEVRSHFLPGPAARTAVRASRRELPAFESYSSLAHRMDSSDFALPRLRPRTSDAETVSALGSAFHLVAQWANEVDGVFDEQALARRTEAAARRYDVPADERERLDSALAAWFSSERYAATRSFDRRRAECPFFVEAHGVQLEGFIDLLCIDDDGADALVIDYKTGTSGEGDELRERYTLQAQCYAFAVLDAGLARRVELAFVRPEAGMEEVVFSFGRADMDELAEALVANRR